MFTGWKDSTWTQEGEKNAKIVARKLKDKHIDVAFHTKLTRSKQTLNEVLKFHPECKLVLDDDRMIERCYGVLQGHTHAVFIREHGRALFEKYHRSYNFPPPKGESIMMVEKRVLPFIKDLLAFMKKFQVNVAISAHGNSMRPFRRHFERKSIKQMMKWEMPYDDYFEYVVEVGKKKQVKLPKKKDWTSVRLPARVKFATNKRNVFRKYY